MKYFLILIFSLLNTLQTYCQNNLVRNYSFEDTIGCPNGLGQINFVKYWYSPTNATPDYFNSCGDVGFKTPLNVFGWQFPISDNGYCAILTYGGSNSKEYLQSELISSLIYSKKYYVSFFVSFADNYKFGNNSMGALFTDSAVSRSDSYTINYIPQIENNTLVLADTSLWYEIKDTMVANGGERYITIGNFKPDSLSDTLTVNQNGITHSYYYIDSITVVEITSSNTINLSNVNECKLQSNIIESNLLFDCNGSEIKKINIVNPLGQSLIEKVNQYAIDCSIITSGFYFANVLFKNGSMKTYKFIKQ